VHPGRVSMPLRFIPLAGPASSPLSDKPDRASGLRCSSKFGTESSSASERRFSESRARVDIFFYPLCRDSCVHCTVFLTASRSTTQDIPQAVTKDDLRITFLPALSTSSLQLFFLFTPRPCPWTIRADHKAAATRQLCDHLFLILGLL
jgi:hypothetical protein